MKIPGVFLMLVCSSISGCFANELKSPNGQIVINFNLQEVNSMKNCPVYQVSFKGQSLIDQSRLGFSLTDGTALIENFKELSEEESSFDNSWKPVYGERSTIRDNYNELVVELAHKAIPGCRLGIIFRCYNSGVAFRYNITKCDTSVDSILIKDEHTEFNFYSDHTVWFTGYSRGYYKEMPVSNMKSSACIPLTFQVNDTTFIALAEAAAADFPALRVTRKDDRSFGFVTRLGSKVKSFLPLKTPWRVIMLATSAGELMENNDIIYNLNEPCKIDEPSWIRPGKVIHGMSDDTVIGKAYIDFAVEHNLKYVQAGFYGSNWGDSNPITIVSGNNELREMIEYANQRGVGIILGFILYVDHLAVKDYSLDEIFAAYQKIGIAGVRVGFMGVESQQLTTWFHQAVRTAAKYKLLVSVLDLYRPSGYSRTYPNLMTQSGLRADIPASWRYSSFNKQNILNSQRGPEAEIPTVTNEQDMIVLFTRMLAGAGDHAICYYNKIVDNIWTHGYQLAKAVCFYSPLTWLYWWDWLPPAPLEALGPWTGVIGNEPELEFYDHIPTVWDDTRVIHGRIGEYAVIARRSDKDWYIGAMNSHKNRTLEVPLDFLLPEENYVAHIYFDDPTINTRTRVGIQRSMVNSGTTLKVKMPAQGGQAIRIVPAGSEDDYPAYQY